MKVFCLLVILFLPIQAMFQMNLPKPEDIERIEISDTGMVKWFQSSELQELLPKFTASEGTYGTKAVPFQYGKFILKNGKEINWMANSKDSILLTEGSTEKLFVLQKEEKAVFPIWDKDGNESFIDINGNPAEKPKEKPVFSEGLAPVKIGDKWGYMNEKGEIVIQPRWKGFGYISPLGNFSEGLAVVYEERNAVPVPDENYTYDTYKCSYINTKGEYVIPPKKFRGSCGNFSEGLARIELDMNGDEYQKGKGYIGFIDKQGNWAIPPQYYQASDFQKGYALVQSEAMPKDLYRKRPQSENLADNRRRKSLYLIDTKGNKVEGVPDCGWRYIFTDGLAFDFDENPQPFNYINEKCEIVFRLPNDVQPENYFYYEGMLLVKKESNGKKMYGYYDTSGKLVVDFKFTSATEFSDGLAGVSYEENGKDYGGYINKSGELVLKNVRNNKPFKNGLALHLLHLWTISERPNARNIYGYMNKKGKYIWLSPGAETRLDKKWIEENYVGPK